MSICFFIKMSLRTNMLLISMNVFSQNLVPNCSFEEFNYYNNEFLKPSEINEIFNDWYSPTTSSPDLIITGNKGPLLQSEKDPYKYRYQFNCVSDIPPYNGDACIGLILQNCFGDCLDGSIIYRHREYLQVKLIRPIKKDRKYNISFYYRLSNTSSYAIDGMGIRFTKKPLIRNNDMGFSGKAQISNSKGNILDNTYWRKFEKEFIADENYKYLTLGNFSHVVNYKKTSEIFSEWDDKCSSFNSYYLFDYITVREYSKADKKITEPVQINVSRDSFNFGIFTNPVDQLTNDTDTIVKKYVIENVLFEFGEDNLNNSAAFLLDKIYSDIISLSWQKMQIIGHTDKIGNSEYNYQLSKNRAKSVADYLIMKGVDKDQIECFGKGENEPIDEINDKLNRRVEIILFN